MALTGLVKLLKYAVIFHQLFQRLLGYRRGETDCGSKGGM